ncbi:MAG: hypothetical protein KF874_13285 [Rhizobiaceae bacterium]|nr:hypothetical protein [Rhizobiaceae bacterium]
MLKDRIIPMYPTTNQKPTGNQQPIANQQAQYYTTAQGAQMPVYPTGPLYPEAQRGQAPALQGGFKYTQYPQEYRPVETVQDRPYELRTGAAQRPPVQNTEPYLYPEYPTAPLYPTIEQKPQVPDPTKLDSRPTYPAANGGIQYGRAVSPFQNAGQRPPQVPVQNIYQQYTQVITTTPFVPLPQPQAQHKDVVVTQQRKIVTNDNGTVETATYKRELTNHYDATVNRPAARYQAIQPAQNNGAVIQQVTSTIYTPGKIAGSMTESIIFE